MLDGKKVRAQLRVERAENGETEFKLSIPQKGAEGILSAMGRTDGGYRSEVCRINGKLCVVSGSSVSRVSREVARKARPSYAEAQARSFQGVEGFATYSWKDRLGDHQGRTEEAGWEGKPPRWSSIFNTLFRRLTSQPSFTLTDVGIRRIK